MVLPYAADWIADMSQGTITPVVVVEFVVSSSFSHFFVSGDRPRLGAQMGLASISPFGETLDPVERGQSTSGRITLVFDDKGSQLRRIASTSTMKGQRVIIRVGDASAATLSDLEIWWDNLRVDDVIAKGGTTIEVPCVDWRVWENEREVGKFQRPDHYLRVAHDLLGLAIFPSGTLDDDSFDERNYPTRSHHVVCRQFANSSDDCKPTTILGSGNSPNEFNGQVKVTEHIKDLSSMSRGAIIQRATGQVKFIEFVRSAPAIRVLQSDDVADFEVIETSKQVINQILMEGNYGGPWREDVAPVGYYESDDATSQADHAFESNSGIFQKIFRKKIHNAWLNSVAKIDPGVQGNFDATTPRVLIRFPFLAGFSGTVLSDATGQRLDPVNGSLPDGAPQDEHTLNGTTRVAFFLLHDHRGIPPFGDGKREIVKATSFTYLVDRGISLCATPVGPISAYNVGSYLIDRGELGTVPVNWNSILQGAQGTPGTFGGLNGNDGLYAYDITIAVFMVNDLLDKMSRGLQLVKWKSPLKHADLEITDFVSPFSDIYLDSESSKADATTVFELIGTQPTLFRGSPGIEFTAIKVRKDTIPIFTTNPDPPGVQAGVPIDLLQDVIVHVGAGFDEVFFNANTTGSPVPVPVSVK